MLRINGIDSIYFGTSTDRAANAGYADGDIFIESDTGKLYQYAARGWVRMAASADDADTLDTYHAAAFALLAGRAGGQSLSGGTAAGDALTLKGSAHASGGPIHLGDQTNYVQIAADGYLTLHGAATAYEDIRIEPTARATGTQAPSFEKWIDDGAGSRGVYLYSFDDAALNSEKEIHFTLQTPHAWAGGNIYIHVHWIAAGTAANSRVKWGLEYTMIEPGGTYAASAPIYAHIPSDSATGTTQHKHMITAFAAITPSASQDGLSTILIGRLFRHSSHADDTYTGKAGLLYIDAHIMIGSFGSNDEYA